MNTDVRGSTTNVIRPDGTSVTGFVYDEFGNQIKTGESDFIVDATYTGSIYDEETGLQYMNARYYDPGVGRFISKDSYRGDVFAPWTQHLYSYTGGNPINYVDPTGHAFDYIYDPGRYGSPGVENLTFGYAMTVIKIKEKLGSSVNAVADIEFVSETLIKQATTDMFFFKVTEGEYMTNILAESSCIFDTIPIINTPFLYMRLDNPFLSVMGTQMSIGDYTLKINAGIVETGVTISSKQENITTSLEIFQNKTDFTYNIRYSKSARVSNQVFTKFTNYSMSELLFDAILVTSITGFPAFLVEPAIEIFQLIR